MRNRLAGLILAVAFPIQAAAFDRVGVLASCEDPTSDTCIRAIFEAARAEIPRIGEEADFDEENGLPAQIRAHLESERAAAEDINNDVERRTTIEEIAVLEANIDALIADSFMWAASIAAYSAIGEDDLDGYRDLGNAMVPDIMDLWTRLLGILEERRKLPLGLEAHRSNFWWHGMALPEVIAFYQLRMGFRSDAARTRAMYDARRADIESPDLERNIPELDLLFRADQFLYRFDNMAEGPGARQVAELVAEFGADTYVTLADLLLENGRYDEARVMIGRVEDPFEAARLMGRLLNEVPDILSAEEFADFLLDIGSGRSGDVPGYWDRELLTKFMAIGRIEELARDAMQDENANRAAATLLTVRELAPHAVTADDLSRFAEARNGQLGGMRSHIARALAEAGRTQQAHEIFALIERPYEATHVLAAIMDNAPDLVTPSELSAFLQDHRDELEGWMLDDLAEAMARAGRIEEVLAIIEAVDDAASRLDLLPVVIDYAPEKMPSKTLWGLLSGRDDSFGENNDARRLARALAGANRTDDALRLLAEIRSPVGAVYVLTEIVETTPEAVPPNFIVEFAKARGEDLNSYFGIIVDSLFEADRGHEAQDLLGVIESASGRAGLLVALLRREPEIVEAQDITELLGADADTLSIGDLGDLAVSLAQAGRLDEARKVGRRYNDVRSDFQEVSSIGAAAYELACGLGADMIFSSWPLVDGLLPDVLSLIDKEPRACGRMTALASVGQALLNERPGQ